MYHYSSWSLSILSSVLGLQRYPPPQLPPPLPSLPQDDTTEDVERYTSPPPHTHTGFSPAHGPQLGHKKYPQIPCSNNLRKQTDNSKYSLLALPLYFSLSRIPRHVGKCGIPISTSNNCREHNSKLRSGPTEVPLTRLELKRTQWNSSPQRTPFTKSALSSFRSAGGHSIEKQQLEFLVSTCLVSNTCVMVLAELCIFSMPQFHYL